MAGTAERTLALKLIADVNGLKPLAKGERQFGKFTKGVLSWGKALGGALIIGGIERVVDSLGEANEAFREEQDIVRSFNRTVKALGLPITRTTRAMDAMADRALNLGFDDAETIQGLNNFLKLTGNIADASKIMGLAQDVARSRNIDLAAAMKIASGVYKGSARALKDYGLEGVKGMEAVSKAREKERGQARAWARAHPMQVRIGKIQDAWADLVGNLAKGDFKGVMAAVGTLGTNIQKALFGWTGKSGKKVPGLIDMVGKWGSDIGGGLIKGLQEVDWVTGLQTAIAGAADGVAEAARTGKLGNLAVLGVAIAGAIFVAETIATVAAAMFKTPAWLAKGTVGVAVAAMGTIMSGVFTAAMWTTQEALNLISNGAKWALGRLDGSKGVIGIAARALGSSMGSIFIVGFAAALVGIAAKNIIIDKLAELFRGFGVSDDVISAARKSSGFGNPLQLLEDLLNNALPGKAAGGPVSGGHPYMVGERGPEMFVPGRSGTIIPNGAGGGNYSINVHVAPGGDLVEAGRQMVRAIQEYEKRGGRTWRN